MAKDTYTQYLFPTGGVILEVPENAHDLMDVSNKDRHDKDILKGNTQFFLKILLSSPCCVFMKCLMLLVLDESHSHHAGRQTWAATYIAMCCRNFEMCL